MTSARANYECHCLVVEYDKRSDAVLREMIGHLRGVTIEELRALVEAGRAAEETIPAEPPSGPVQPTPSRRAPLVLPTVSLAMAFSANPLVQAVNFPLMAWNAYPIALRAWRVWRREGRLNIDFLDVLAVSASMAQGNPMAGAVITWLIKLGDWIRDLTAAGSRRAVADLLEFRAKTAWVMRDGVVVSVPAKSLAVGDSVVVYPGEMVPVDGEITAGSAMIDQKPITGESLPVARGVGQAAFAATVLHEGQVTVRAIRVGGEATAGQIARLVDAVPLGATRMQNHAEKLADRLVMPTLGLASGAAALTGDFNRFLSLVIVDYGTGIRVAAPTAVLSSMTEAARAGIIIKSGAHLERLCEADTIVFDKTGTLSHGEPTVHEVIGYLDHVTPEHLVGLAAAAETKLKHPVAEALRAKARQLRANMPECDETQYRLGLGVEGQVNGYYLHVGSERFLRQSGIRLDRSAADRERFAERGWSCLHVAIDGAAAGLVAYADRIREESRSVIARLAGCVAVLGLAARASGEGPDVGYFAARAALSRLVSSASILTVERGAAAATTPAASAVAASIAPRFGIVVSEWAAASALPVFGALGGATLNMLFVRHFQRAAHGHFTVRRLERLYGPDVVGAYYRGLVLKPPRTSKS